MVQTQICAEPSVLKMYSLKSTKAKPTSLNISLSEARRRGDQYVKIAFNSKLGQKRGGGVGEVSSDFIFFTLKASTLFYAFQLRKLPCS